MAVRSGQHLIRGRAVGKSRVLGIIDDLQAESDPATDIDAISDAVSDIISNVHCGPFTDADLLARLREGKPLLASSGRD